MKILLVIVSFVMLLKPVLPVIEYAANYDYISKVLCVNKAKPAMHCNGKCHLMKELAKASETEKPISSDKKNTASGSELLFFQEIKSLVIAAVFQNTPPKKDYSYTNLYAYLNSRSVFHPPTFIS